MDLLRRIARAMSVMLAQLGERLARWAAAPVPGGVMPLEAVGDGPPAHWLALVQARAPWLLGNARSRFRSRPPVWPHRVAAERADTAPVSRAQVTTQTVLWPSMSTPVRVPVSPPPAVRRGPPGSGSARAMMHAPQPDRASPEPRSGRPPAFELTSGGESPSSAPVHPARLSSATHRDAARGQRASVAPSGPVPLRSVPAGPARAAAEPTDIVRPRGASPDGPRLMDDATGPNLATAVPAVHQAQRADEAIGPNHAVAAPRSPAGEAASRGSDGPARPGTPGGAGWTLNTADPALEPVPSVPGAPDATIGPVFPPDDDRWPQLPEGEIHGWQTDPHPRRLQDWSRPDRLTAEQAGSSWSGQPF